MLRTVICGAGVTGLTLAAQLGRSGWNVVVLTPATRVPGGGFLVKLCQDGLGAARRLGLLPYLVEHREPLLECLEGAPRKLFQFFKQRFVHRFEIETRFPLHPRLQLLRHTLQQIRSRIETHVVKAHVTLPDLHPRNRHWRLVRWVRTTLQAVARDAILAHLQLTGVPFENRPESGKHFGERIGHVRICA